MVAPPGLRERLVELKQLTGFYTSWPLQQVLTALPSSGKLERHIRRMRRHYAEKRRLLGEILTPLAGRARLEGLEAGLHAYLALDTGIAVRKVATAALRGGVRVETIDGYYLGPPDRNGLLLDYASLSHDEIQRSASTLAGIIAGA